MQIDLHRVTKQLGSTTAVKNVSLSIPPARIVAVLGDNGAGKSTLLRLLAGVLVPTSGTIHFDGEPFSRDRIDLRKRFGFLPDTPAIFRNSTPIAHIGMCLRLYDAHRPGIEALCISLLRDFDLLPLAEMPLNKLSRGQAYKTGLVGLIAADPEVWLLDEPFASGMDPRGLAAFRRHVQKAVGRQRTIVYSTQLIELAESFSDEIIVLRSGKLRVQSPSDQLQTALGEGEHVLQRLFSEPESH